MRQAVVVIMLVAVGFAGCVGGDDDATGSGADDNSVLDNDTLHEVAEMLPFEVTADDGTPLRGHVYLPDGEAPFATALELSPYWNTQDEKGHSEDQVVDIDGRRTLPGRLGSLIEAGFAVALVNPRGTGESGGCFQWRGPVDVTDTATIIEALADQPWSNGAVGMTGLSYPAGMQYVALQAPPPSLKAIVPVSGIIDEWSLFTYHGAITRFGAQSYPTQLAAGTTGYPMLERGELGDTDASHAPCPGYAEDLLTHEELVRTGDRTGFWDLRDRRPAIASTNVPILVANGLTNAEGHILQVEGLWDLISHGEKRFLVGQWPHAYPFEDEVRFTAEYTVPWLDHHLRGGPALLEPGVVEYQDAAGTWYTTDRWPPTGVPVRLLPSGDALVTEADQVETGAQRFASSDWTHAPDDCPGFEATYVSSPLAEDVLLAGNFQINLTITSTQPDGNIAVTLWHVDDLLPCDGRVQRASEEETFFEPLEVARAHTDLRHRGHLDVGRPFPVGDAEVLRMTSEPFATQVAAGERLVLTVGGGDLELAPKVHKPMLTVHTGPDVEGELVLNVVEGNLTFVADGEIAAGLG